MYIHEYPKGEIVQIQTSAELSIKHKRRSFERLLVYNNTRALGCRICFDNAIEILDTLDKPLVHCLNIRLM